MKTWKTKATKTVVRRLVDMYSRHGIDRDSYRAPSHKAIVRDLLLLHEPYVLVRFDGLQFCSVSLLSKERLRAELQYMRRSGWPKYARLLFLRMHDHMELIRRRREEEWEAALI